MSIILNPSSAPEVYAAVFYLQAGRCLRPDSCPCSRARRRRRLTGANRLSSPATARATGECVALTRRVRGENPRPSWVASPAFTHSHPGLPPRCARLSKLVRLFGLRAVSPRKRVNASSRTALPKQAACRTAARDEFGVKLAKVRPLVSRPEIGSRAPAMFHQPDASR